MSRANYDSLESFASTAIDTIIKVYEEGLNYLTFSAPLAMYFDSSPYADPVAPYIPATYAMLTAQSLGMGRCMLGTPHFILNFFGKKIKEKYGISSGMSIKMPRPPTFKREIWIPVSKKKEIEAYYSPLTGDSVEDFLLHEYRTKKTGICFRRYIIPQAAPCSSSVVSG